MCFRCVDAAAFAHRRTALTARVARAGRTNLIVSRAVVAGCAAAIVCIENAFAVRKMVIRCAAIGDACIVCT